MYIKFSSVSFTTLNSNIIITSKESYITSTFNDTNICIIIVPVCIYIYVCVCVCVCV